MKHAHFIDAVDDARVVAAIQQAERKTSAEFRVFVDSRAADQPVAAAERQFQRMKMQSTRQRNAVLVFVAPKSQTFALYADVAAHAALGRAAFDRLAAEMSARFAQAGYTEGLTHVIDALAESLSISFPFSQDSGNELSDSVERT